MKIERFEDIEAWQLARVLTEKVYRRTKKPDFSKDEFNEVYRHAARTRVAVRGLIKYLKKFEKGLNAEPWPPGPLDP